MQLDHEFTVPVPAAKAWPVLMDVQRIAPCMPGATVTKVDGQDVEGTVKVKVGPVTVTYSGTATFLEIDETAHRAVIEARGRETRGSGTASARVTTVLHDAGEQTRVTVSTDLSVTGKPAQFGRGVISDVGSKLLGQFASCLSQELAGLPTAVTAAGTAPAGTAAGTAPAGTAPAETATSTPAGEPAASGSQAPAAVLDAASQPALARRTDEAIDLLGTAGLPLLKRAAPVIGAAALVALVVLLLRRRLA